MKCAAFSHSRKADELWLRCRQDATQGRFCDRHAEAIQGVMLGLMILDSPHLRPSEKEEGTERIRAREAIQQSRAKRKEREHGGGGE